MIAPTLHTQNLTLRMPRLADFEPRAEFASARIETERRRKQDAIKMPKGWS